MESFFPKKQKQFHGILYYLIGKYQFTPKCGEKKFQIVRKGNEKKYKMITKSGKSVHLQAVTMINPATG